MPIKKAQKHRHLPAFILLTLAQNSAHGGAIYNSLIKNIPDFHCDTAAVYRTLKQLEEEKAVSFSWDTTHSGPARKIYKITPIGLNELENWKKDMEGRIIKLNYFLNTYNSLTL